MNLKEKLQHKIDNKTKPIGSLGRLEELALQIGLIQKTESPSIEKPTFLVFAGDHGLTEEGISPFPKEVTAQMVKNFINGGAGINVFCKLNGIDLKVIDAGVDYEFNYSGELINAKIKGGTANALLQPAMTSEECLKAVTKGREIVKNIAKQGCNTIGFGEMGIGNTSSAALLMSMICKIPIEKCVGRGTGVNDAGFRRKKEVLKKVVLKYNGITGPLNILSVVGGFEIAAMVGAMMQAAESDMILLIDGFIATSAFIVAHSLNDEILKNAIFCHQSDEQGHKLMLEYLNVKPLLNLGMRLGEGSGAAIAFPIIKSAVVFLNDMASFESAGISSAV